jgi:molecular chaperone GrpE
MAKHDGKKNKQDRDEQAAGQENQTNTELREALEKAAQLEKELAGTKDRHLRAVAELENYKRRTEKEKAELSAYVKAGVFRDILSLVDDFERFFQHVENSQAELDKGFVQGVELIHKSLQKMLERHGIEPVGETGVPVDYNIHEAVMTAPVEDEKQDNTVLDVLEVGYRIGEMLIRPAKVRVGIHG